MDEVVQQLARIVQFIPGSGVDAKDTSEALQHRRAIDQADIAERTRAHKATQTGLERLTAALIDNTSVIRVMPSGGGGDGRESQ